MVKLQADSQNTYHTEYYAVSNRRDVIVVTGHVELVSIGSCSFSELETEGHLGWFNGTLSLILS